MSIKSAHFVIYRMQGSLVAFIVVRADGGNTHTVILGWRCSHKLEFKLKLHWEEVDLKLLHSRLDINPNMRCRITTGFYQYK